MDWGQSLASGKSSRADPRWLTAEPPGRENKTGIFLALTHPSGEAILVVVSSDAASLGGLVTVVNSAVKHTRLPIFFCLVVDSEETYSHLRSWIDLTPALRRVTYSLRIFPPNKAKSSLPQVCPEAGGRRVIYLDRDVVVQSDLSGLYTVAIPTKKWAAAADECAAPSRRLMPKPSSTIYAGQFKMKDPILVALKIMPQMCTFDTGVMVVDLAAWRENGLSENLRRYTKASPSFLSQPYSDASSAALLLALYNRTAILDPLWNVRSLGQTRGSIYSPAFAAKAHILHWSGHFKPWGRKAPFAHLWDKHYLPDPTQRFRPVRTKAIREAGAE